LTSFWGGDAEAEEEEEDDDDDDDGDRDDDTDDRSEGIMNMDTDVADSHEIRILENLKKEYRYRIKHWRPEPWQEANMDAYGDCFKHYLQYKEGTLGKRTCVHKMKAFFSLVFEVYIGLMVAFFFLM